MNLQQLDFFIECAIFRSMRKVAQLRYCSNSLVSRQISSLEQELGVVLFEKRANGLEITDKGEVFLIWALKTREEYHNLRTKISSPSSLDSNDCQIACYIFDDTYRHISHLLDFLPTASKGYSYSLHIVPLGSMVPQVLNDRFDAGVIHKAALQRYPDAFNSIRFALTNYKLTIGHNHPLFHSNKINVDALLQNYSCADEFFLPGSLKKYQGHHFENINEIKQLARDYIHEYMQNPAVYGQWTQTLCSIDSFNAEVTFGKKMAITVETLSIHNNTFLNSIPFIDDEMSEETCIFWKKDSKNAGLMELVSNL